MRVNVQPLITLEENLGLSDDNDDVVVVKSEDVAVVSTAPGASRKRKLEQAQDEVKAVKIEAKAAKTEARRVSNVLDSVADEYTCPIVFELPIHPVIAKNGNIYEQGAIKKWLNEKRTSPSTNLPMDRELAHFRNAG